jgi:glucose repression regulatory protein TUP1
MSRSARKGKSTTLTRWNQDFVLSVCLTPDGKGILSGSKDRGVQFWDSITSYAQIMLQGHKNSGSCGI